MEQVSDFKAWILSGFDSVSKRNIKSIKKYTDFNKSFFRGARPNVVGAILVDCFPVPDWVFVNSLFLNIFAKENNYEIISYGLRKRDQFTNALYDSFGCNRHLKVKLTRSMRQERLNIFCELKRRIHNKQDIFNLKVNNIWVGMDIYESILRGGVPTVNIKSLHSWRIIYYAMSYLVFFQESFKSEN